MEAVDSVLNQSYPYIKIYIIEDGSTDFSVYWKKLKNHPHVHYVRLNQNQGVSFCRNLGADLGSSPYIAFLDSDDLWDSEKLAKQIEYMELNPLVQWSHTNETWKRNGEHIHQKKEHKMEGGSIITKLMERCLISPSTVLFKRPFFSEHGKFLNHFRIAEDYELWLRLNIHFPIGHINSPLATKRAGTWSQLSSTLEIDRFRVLALHRFYRLYKNDPAFLQIEQQWREIILKKINILIKGGTKYSSRYLKKYHCWKTVFEISRTTEKRTDSSGTLR